MAGGRRPQNIGHYNNKLVARLLLDNVLSGQEVSQIIGLTKMAGCNIIDRLLNMELIKLSESVPEKRNRGRQHVRYTINADRAYFVCISFQHAYESFAICDLKGRVIHEEKLTDRFVDKQYFDEVLDHIERKLGEYNISKEEIAAISVAVSGQINEYTGKIMISFGVSRDFIIKDSLAERFPFAKTEVKNDIVYCCLKSIISDEFDYDNGMTLFVYKGHGIANVLVHDKQIIAGTDGFSGEIGANSFGRNEFKLYDILNDDTLLETGRRTLKDATLTIDKVIERAEENEELRSYFLTMAENFGILVRNVIDIAGCSHVVLSGKITKYPRFFFDRFQKTLKDCVYSDCITYKVDLSNSSESLCGQIALSRLNALDWVLEHY